MVRKVTEGLLVWNPDQAGLAEVLLAKAPKPKLAPSHSHCVLTSCTQCYLTSLWSWVKFRGQISQLSVGKKYKTLLCISWNVLCKYSHVNNNLTKYFRMTPLLGCWVQRQNLPTEFTHLHDQSFIKIRHSLE